ncbi:MAG: PAS/PAC and GAF sensor-containing diguanylate cyclase/phosphodiesterase, partial [Comamonadaceae bacterium]
MSKAIIRAMSSTLHSGQPLRQFMLRRVGALVTATALLVAAGFVWFGVLPMTRQMAHDQFEVAAMRVESGAQLMFSPAQHVLAIAQGVQNGHLPDLHSPKEFNRLLKPVLVEFEQITSVVAGTSSGQGWLLLQLSEGRWRNRMTDVPRWGDKHHLFFDEAADGSVNEHWGDIHYDPRLRPWFTGALTAASPGVVHWTEPYTFFSTREPGITASTRMRLPDGRDFVMGIDLTLRDLSKMTMQTKVGQHGLVLLMTDDERVLSLPAMPESQSPKVWLERVLQPVQDLGLPQVTAALTTWREQHRPRSEVLSFASGGAQWLVSSRPYALGNQQFWVLVLAPAADFAPAWKPMAGALTAAWVLVLALVMWLARAGTARLSRPLEVLADNSRRIGLLNFEPLQAVHSRVAEIQQLANNQQTMLHTLRHKQHELDARAKELGQQVAALKATEFSLQQHNDMLHTIIENFPGGVSVVDANLQLVAFNNEFQTMLSLPETLLKQTGVGFEDIIRFNALRGDYGPTDVDTQVSDRVALARQFQPHRFERTLPNGRTMEVRGMPLPQGGFVTLYIDVTASKQHELELEHLAHFDPLTSLPNRVLLADRLRQGMAQVVRRGQQLGVVYLDLDGFKAINDSYGHEIGDQLLVALATRMRQALRDGDTLARIGGDEFVAVLMDVAGMNDSLPMLQRLLHAAGASLTLAGFDLTVSASIGVTFYPQAQEVDAEQLVRQADQAMYLAKQAGKNCYHVFDTEQDRHLRGQFESLKRIVQALAQAEFVLYYQPKVNMCSGKVIGVEALIRWQHPQQGLLTPALFLPAIEDDPLAIEVGEWVVRTALAQLAIWQAQGLSLTVSVNVGARQLQHSGFAAFLRMALAAQPQINPANLQIEVLETSALQDMSHVTEVMAQCRQLGVSFALDDFGTGYSSLTYLKRLPVSELKIDQSFVRDMLDDP